MAQKTQSKNTFLVLCLHHTEIILVFFSKGLKMESVIYWLRNYHGYKVSVINWHNQKLSFQIELPNGAIAFLNCEELTSGRLTTVVITMDLRSDNGLEKKENAFKMNDDEFLASDAEECFFWIVREADSFDK